MARRFISLALSGLLLSGCVAQDKYNAKKIELDQANEQLVNSQNSESAARAKAEATEKQLQALLARGDDERKLSDNLQKQNAEMAAQLAELNEKYKNSIDRPVVFSNPLPEALNAALAQFARENPDLVEFDQAHGLVKFKSDVTFAKGSAELTPQARQVIGRFAGILGSPAANSFEFLVAGHTDSTPVTNQATILAGHKDNWHLSSHRAIAVGGEIIRHNISSRRVGMLGYADQRPIASNGTEDGKAKNRRVEVLILPTTVKGGSVAGEPVQAAPVNNRKAPPVAPKNLNKDAATIDQRPLLNK